jgi:hypothetical protein
MANQNGPKRCVSEHTVIGKRKDISAEYVEEESYD